MIGDGVLEVVEAGGDLGVGLLGGVEIGEGGLDGLRGLCGWLSRRSRTSRTDKDDKDEDELLRRRW